MDFKNKNIGFFDSGIGGISVLKNAINLLENETFIYFGDSKNTPYGSKTQNEIIKLCINICDFLIYENNCKAIVVACNTASSAAIKVLREKYEPYIPIIAIEPAIKPAVEYMKSKGLNKKILLLATPFTIRGDKLRYSLDLYKDIEIKCIGLKDLAYMIEEDLSKNDIYDYLQRELENFCDEVDCVVLGCTHYYFVKDILKDILGENVKTFDGLHGTSKELKRRLEIIGLENTERIDKIMKVYIYNSLNQSKVLRCYDLLGGGLR